MPMTYDNSKKKLTLKTISHIICGFVLNVIIAITRIISGLDNYSF